jgi:hypothetical protein
MTLGASALAENKLFCEINTWFSSRCVGRADFITVITASKGIDEFFFDSFEDLASAVILFTLSKANKEESGSIIVWRGSLLSD